MLHIGLTAGPPRRISLTHASSSRAAKARFERGGVDGGVAGVGLGAFAAALA